MSELNKIYEDCESEVTSHYNSEDGTTKCYIDDYEDNNSLEIISNAENMGVTIRAIDHHGQEVFCTFYKAAFAKFLEESKKCLLSD